jgi:ribonuclease BN (tRNA processing enzyme)
VLERDVAPGIHRIEDAYTNWYLVEEDGALTVIDAGVRTSWSSLVAALNELRRPPGDIAALVLTHAHFDHHRHRRARVSERAHRGRCRRHLRSVRGEAGAANRVTGRDGRLGTCPRVTRRTRRNGRRHGAHGPRTAVEEGAEAIAEQARRAPVT